jgi:hypothetical protein
MKVDFECLKLAYLPDKTLLAKKIAYQITAMGLRTYIKDNFIADIKPYKPKKLRQPEKMLEIVSAWKGLELIIEDIIDEFGLGRKRCIEFGVEFGYSAVVFSNFFESVTGVDTFEGDVHTVNKNEHFEETSKRLAAYTNIKLVKSDYRDWIIQTIKDTIWPTSTLFIITKKRLNAASGQHNIVTVRFFMIPKAFRRFGML